jgi:hypothetical protein
MVDTRSPHVIVWERHGQWSRALRRFIAPRVRVEEMLPASWRDIPPHRGPRVSLAVVADADDASWALTWAERVALEQADALRMAVVRPAAAELAWCLRETGVAMVWDEFWQVPTMARLIERFWQRIPAPDLSVEERIWNNLPWNPTDAE